MVQSSSYRSLNSTVPKKKKYLNLVKRQNMICCLHLTNNKNTINEEESYQMSFSDFNSLSSCSSSSFSLRISISFIILLLREWKGNRQTNEIKIYKKNWKNMLAWGSKSFPWDNFFRLATLPLEKIFFRKRKKCFTPSMNYYYYY